MFCFFLLRFRLVIEFDNDMQCPSLINLRFTVDVDVFHLLLRILSADIMFFLLVREMGMWMCPIEFCDVMNFEVCMYILYSDWF